MPVSNGNFVFFHPQARNKPADGVGHVNQKGASGQKATTAGQKVAPGGKGGTKSSQKPTAQKGQVKVTPKSASVKTGKNKKKGQRQQYDLIVTINLVSLMALDERYIGTWYRYIDCRVESLGTRIRSGIARDACN